MNRRKHKRKNTRFGKKFGKTVFALCASSLMMFGGCIYSSNSQNQNQTVVKKLNDENRAYIWKLFYVHNSCRYGDEFYSVKVRPEDSAMYLIGKGGSRIRNLLKINNVFGGEPYLIADKDYVHILLVQMIGNTLYRVRKDDSEVMHVYLPMHISSPVAIGANKGNVYILSNRGDELNIVHQNGMVELLPLKVILRKENISSIIKPVLDTNPDGSVVLTGENLKNAYIVDPNTRDVSYVPLKNVGELKSPRIDIFNGQLCVLPNSESNIVCIDEKGDVRTIFEKEEN